MEEFGRRQDTTPLAPNLFSHGAPVGTPFWQMAGHWDDQRCRDNCHGCKVLLDHAASGTVGVNDGAFGGEYSEELLHEWSAWIANLDKAGKDSLRELERRTYYLTGSYWRHHSTIRSAFVDLLFTLFRKEGRASAEDCLRRVGKELADILSSDISIHLEGPAEK